MYTGGVLLSRSLNDSSQCDCFHVAVLGEAGSRMVVDLALHTRAYLTIAGSLSWAGWHLIASSGFTNQNEDISQASLIKVTAFCSLFDFGSFGLIWVAKDLDSLNLL